VALPDIEPLAAESIPPLAWEELRTVLDEELNRLAEKYRVPLVLHYLEGKTVEQVAAELAWPFGTVCARLTRGKEQLRVRLVLADRPAGDIGPASWRYLLGWAGPISGVRTGLAMP
jgi:DNA-directed RNA polymerase specialized sigma24 family protein